MTKYFAALLMLFVAWPSFATDPNGYTAKYECRAGNVNCNVDIANYVARACDQTITTADSAATISTKINGGSQYICVANGDYTAKGTITITVSGNSSAYKVLRYSRSSDNNDDPWNQSAANQAKMPRINIDGQQYWIIHRLTFDGVTAPAINIGSSSATSNVIINRVLMQNLTGTPTNVVGGLQVKNASSYIWLQDSVCRNFEFKVGLEISCIYDETSHHVFMVNNESYNVSGADWQDQGGASDSVRGSVVENNDFYITDAYRYDGSGNQKNGGAFMASKSTVSSKRGGSSSAPVEIFHNRIWGKRESDRAVCCTSTGSGFAFLWSNNDNADTAHTQYQLVQNNIVVDTSGGVNVPRSGPTRNSAIGNIFYLVRNYSSKGRGVFTPYIETNSAYYLNTIIESDRHLLVSGDSTDDFRCNVYINAGDKSGTPGSGTVFDNNVWYGTASYTTESPNHDYGNYVVKTRQNNTAYNLGDIIRTSSNPEMSCAATTDSACFLYKVTTAGTSSGSAISYTTTLGGTTQDGTMTVTAIRGPYSFFRKLRTSPSRYVIPYARPYSQAPEYGVCPIDALGNRTNVGAGVSIAN